MTTNTNPQEPPSLEAVYDHLFSCAAKIVATGEEHQPILFAMREDGEVAGMSLIGAPKETIMRLHKTAAANAAASILIMEAWVANITGDEAKQANADGYTGLPPSERPDRREAIIFNVLTPTRQALAICMIDRATGTLEKGKLTWNGTPGETSFTGNMVREEAPRTAH